MKKIKKKYLHIALIIVGIVFILLPAFHNNIWFDESYSVSIAKHSFSEIWTITGHDVHPPLYYWLLHIVWMVFGNNIIALRIFSTLSIAILGILGYTHIRKDFGEKVGFLFTFLVYFLPIMSRYSQEIRMYSLACLLVTVMSIYAYRLYKAIKENRPLKEQNKNLIIFGIFSILSCYTHYYALATAGLMNIIIFVYLIRNVLKSKKQANNTASKAKPESKKILINFIIIAAIQVILYIPWLILLIAQMTRVGGGFWIQLGLDTLIEVPSVQFRIQTESTINATAIISLVIAILMYIYVGYRIYKAKKDKEEILPGIIPIIIYVTVIIAVLIISLIGSPILVARYLLVLTGLYVFVIAFFMAKEKRKWITTFICIVILLLGGLGNFNNIKNSYSQTNDELMQFMKENIQKDDIIIYNEIGVGGVLATYLPENKQYFYNQWNWDVEEAYKAYAPAMETVYSYDEVLKDYKGRVWIVGTIGSSIYNDFPRENMEELEGPVEFKIDYQDCSYQFTLLETD